MDGLQAAEADGSGSASRRLLGESEEAGGDAPSLPPTIGAPQHDPEARRGAPQHDPEVKANKHETGAVRRRTGQAPESIGNSGGVRRGPLRERRRVCVQADAAAPQESVRASGEGGGNAGNDGGIAPGTPWLSSPRRMRVWVLR
jgi:hypothetical protein